MNLEETSTSVALDRISAHFSASHALISDDYEEGLHGHNYEVEIEVYGKTDENNIIIDFIFLENLLSEILTAWDHYVLIPSKNTRLEIKENKDNFDLKYGDRYYSIPQTDVKLLDCTNVTTEVLARLLGEKIQLNLKEEIFWDRILSIKITVWETPHYRASYTLTSSHSKN